MPKGPQRQKRKGFTKTLWDIGDVVRLILSVAACALVLAGCASAYDKSAEASACKRGADRASAPQVSGPGFVMTGGLVIPGRDLGGSGKLDKDWGNFPCIREEQNGTNPPKSYDLHKIGMAL